MLVSGLLRPVFRVLSLVVVLDCIAPRQVNRSPVHIGRLAPLCTGCWWCWQRWVPVDARRRTCAVASRLCLHAE
jgi:hypothetical protein